MLLLLLIKMLMATFSVNITQSIFRQTQRSLCYWRSLVQILTESKEFTNEAEPKPSLTKGGTKGTLVTQIWLSLPRLNAEFISGMQVTLRFHFQCHLSKSILTDSQAKSRWKDSLVHSKFQFLSWHQFLSKMGQCFLPSKQWQYRYNAIERNFLFHFNTIHPLIYPHTVVIMRCQSHEAVNKMLRFRLEKSTSKVTVGQLSNAMPGLKLSSILNALVLIHSQNLNRPHWSRRVL